MATIVEAEDIISEFIRAEVTEITRVDFSNRQVADSQNFSGDASTTVFTLTNTPVCINSVVVDSVTQAKHIAYTIDLRAKTITFTTAPASGTDNIVVSYDKGNTWVYPDKPRLDLAESSYPRVSVTTITQSELPLGVGINPPYWMDGVYQIDILSWNRMECTINSMTELDQTVANHIAREIIKAFKLMNLNKLGLKLYTPRILSNTPAPFDESRNVYRRIMEVRFEAQNIGE